MDPHGVSGSEEIHQEPDEKSKSRLRAKIRGMLQEQGYGPNSLWRTTPRDLSKEQIRELNHRALNSRRDQRRKGLERHESRLLKYFADGSEVDPHMISPRLVEVQSESEEELLFRYACLHWSIPVSSGYGRRLRFLVFDQHNGKLIGLFGLGDPVFALGPRDRWIGWDGSSRSKRLRHLMDAFVLGSVPPYNQLICGKLIALLMTSNEVRGAFFRKYVGLSGRISDDRFDGTLALMTTTSALGKSSVYNRLKFHSERAFISVGFTAGSGEFHFSNGLYNEILDFAQKHCTRSAKNSAWGTGWRSRREVIRAVLAELQMPRDLLYHGVRRELFVAPMASNARAFLRGEADDLTLLDRPAEKIWDWFRDRWLMNRAKSRERFIDFRRESLRIWRAEL